MDLDIEVFTLAQAVYGVKALVYDLTLKRFEFTSEGSSSSSPAHFSHMMNTGAIRQSWKSCIVNSLNYPVFAAPISKRVEAPILYLAFWTSTL